MIIVIIKKTTNGPMWFESCSLCLVELTTVRCHHHHCVSLNFGSFFLNIRKGNGESEQQFKSETANDDCR